jgi:putative spermidine/putrescine transport system substrate-binding protein
MPFVSRAWAQQTTVTLAAYGGIFRENYEKYVLEPFHAAHPNITVSYYQMNNSAQNLGTIRGQAADPQIDLSILDVTLGKGGTDEGLFKPVTSSRRASPASPGQP